MFVQFNQSAPHVYDPPADELSRPSDADSRLIARARAGDMEAMGHLCERFAPQFLRYVTTRLGDPGLTLEDEAHVPAGDATDSDRHLVLVVDDYAANRTSVARMLKRQGHEVMTAGDGFEALDLMRQNQFDLVLLDILMPEMNGYMVLEHLRDDPQLRHVPVVVISAIDDFESVVRCIELGAEDYMFKPFDPVLLRARTNACLEKKRLRDREQAYLTRLKIEQEQSERLLLNILPRPVAERLKQNDDIIAESFDDVTVLFADIVDFTALAARIAPTELITLLNGIFSCFDALAERYGLEKIKTIGDAYMVVGGLPTPRADHAEAIAQMALAMQEAISAFSDERGETFTLRIGISSGPAIAGVIGTKKFIYDLWGDTVNTASRMESLCTAGSIQVSAATYERLRTHFRFEERGPLHVKGKGEMTTYLLMGK